MAVLVDTSVWVDHLRHGNSRLTALLRDGLVACHSFVIGEVSLGHLRNRAELLSLLESLPRVSDAGHEEVVRYVDMNALPGTGIGWVDAHLLCAAQLDGIRLWTADRRLSAVAAHLGLAFSGRS